MCTGIEAVGVNINFRHFPTGWELPVKICEIVYFHLAPQTKIWGNVTCAPGGKQNFPILYVRTGFEPIGVYVNFANCLLGTYPPNKQLAKIYMHTSAATDIFCISPADEFFPAERI